MAAVAMPSSNEDLSRQTSSPLPHDAALMPGNFIDHLYLITGSILKTTPPKSLQSAYGSPLNGHEAAGSSSDGSSSSSASSIVTLPLPRYHFEGGNEKTAEIEANIGTLVERLWRAENQLEMIAQSHPNALTNKGPAESSAPRPIPSRGQEGGAKRESDEYEAPAGVAATSANSERRSSFAKFPYPISQDHPQSSSFPLSYPLGMGSDGPVLLASSTADPESAVGAFERYSDESGLSAQDELRLLKAQVQDIARVCKAVAFGDLSQHITVPVQGHVMVELKDIINQMVDRLSVFATEVTRVSLEVGTEGRLGGQVEVEGVEGRWKELKDVVNRLAANLTTQVRGVATVTKAVARGDLSKKIEVEANGEVLELKLTINVMVDQLRHFANEVTRVSREVGSQGMLGGQADVPGVEGVWKEYVRARRPGV